MSSVFNFIYLLQNHLRQIFDRFFFQREQKCMKTYRTWRFVNCFDSMKTLSDDSKRGNQWAWPFFPIMLSCDRSK